jgi:aminopeptidase N
MPAINYKDLERASENMSEAELDAFIKWKAEAVAVLKNYKLDTIMRGAIMQRQFTVELRVDFADPDKLPAMKKVLQQAARHAFATAQLISDNPKLTQIAIYSDDFFSGHEEIKLLDDAIQEGLDATGEALPDAAEGVSAEDANMAEMAAALGK